MAPPDMARPRTGPAIREQSQVTIEPMQLAGLLLEKTMEQVSDEEVKQFLRTTTTRR